MKTITGIIVLGVLVHLISILVILPVEDVSPPISDRVVLFVADFLRAEEIYKNTENITPFVNYIRASKGCCGVSLTLVPTESRTGYVVMLAGIYENPSAVFKGWKSNPMCFDHILLQTKSAWTVSTFMREGQSHIITFMYDSSVPEFGHHNTSVLDTWVFNKLNEFLDESEKPWKMKEIKSIFFSHLLGIDTAEHVFKPQSREYIEDIEIIDEGIAQIVEKFDNIFNDNATTYIFTSDHGMTNWRSQGSGFDVENHIPFIAWGTGIKKSKANITLNQIDIATLISNIFGISIPVRSLGITPHESLKVSNEDLKYIVLKNIRQLESIYEFKFNTIRSYTMMVSYAKPTFFKENIESLSQYNVTDKQELIKFVHESLNTMRHLLEGINHYQYWNRQISLILVALGFMLWITTLSINNITWGDVVLNTAINHNFKIISILSVAVVFGTYEMSIFWFCGSYEYTRAIIRLLMECMVINLMFQYRRMLTFKRISYQYFRRNVGNWIKTFIMFLMSISALILGLKHHPAWFSVMLFVQMIWLQLSPKFSQYRRDEHSEYGFEKLFRITMNGLLGLFPALSAITTSYQYYWSVGGFFVWSIVNSEFSQIIQENYYLRNLFSLSYKVQRYFFALSFIFVQLIDYGFIGTTFFWKLLSWILSVVPLLCIPFVPCYQLMRLTSVIFGFGSYYTLMSKGSEQMFMATFITVLFLWFQIESTRSDSNIRSYLVLENAHFQRLPFWADEEPSTDNIRIVSQYICFLMIGFFGTGSAANKNFFDPMWTRCFGTVLSRFTMAALIIMKIIKPLLLVTCFFRGIIIMRRLNLLAIFSYIIFIADCCFMYCMFSIKNTGSWLDIYTSISHFVIMGVLVIVIPLLYGIAYLLTTVFIRRDFVDGHAMAHGDHNRVIDVVHRD